LNLEVEALERTRQQQEQQIGERDRAIKGYTADLEEFRQRLTLAETQLKELDDKLGAMTRERNRLAAEREQLVKQRDELKTSVEKWTAAVGERDVALKKRGEEIQKLAAERNESVAKFNELAGKYNVLVKDLDKARARQ